MLARLLLVGCAFLVHSLVVFFLVFILKVLKDTNSDRGSTVWRKQNSTGRGVPDCTINPILLAEDLPP